jgi:hypothetical protein
MAVDQGTTIRLPCLVDHLPSEDYNDIFSLAMKEILNFHNSIKIGYLKIIVKTCS